MTPNFLFEPRPLTNIFDSNLKQVKTIQHESTPIILNPNFETVLGNFT